MTGSGVNSVNTKEISPKYLSEWLEVPLEIASKSLKDMPRAPMNFIIPDSSDQLRILKECHRKLEFMMTKPSSDLKKKNWESRWQTVSERVAAEGVSEESLRPAYFDRKMLRLRGTYIHGLEASFAYSLHLAILRVLFLHHLQGATSYTELGSGTGINLLLLSKLFPGAAFLGTDWSKNSLRLMDAIGAARDVNLEGRGLDLRTMEGGETIQVPPDGAILTIHALEQIGMCYESVLSFLLAQPARVVFHLEPLVELYDATANFDILASAYHRHLGYLEGYLPTLQNLEKKGVIEIMECKRLGFGDVWHEAYGLVIWRRS